MSNRRLTDRQKKRISSIQEQRRSRAIVKNAISDDQINNLGNLGAETVGIVISNFGSQVDIEAIENNMAGIVVRCHMRANLEPLVTGDRVIWRPAEPYGVVVARLDRRSELVRPDIYGKLRPVAANVDLIAIIFSPKPTAFSNLIDRYLVAAEAQNIQPILILNKTDLLTNQEFADIAQLVKDYEFIGYDVLKVCAKTGRGMKALQRYLTDKTAVFVGQSGVGKSSLINSLHPDANMPVGELSIGKEKGTHTTTVSRLFHLTHGGILIDSPGIREFSLTHLSQTQVIDGFIDFQPYLRHCKFRDCSHDKEVSCGLLAAVADNKVLESRLKNYRQIILSLQSERD